MREDLALKHLLLAKARQLAKDYKELNSLIAQLTQNLTIEYQRQNQKYVISSQVKDQRVSLEIDKQDFLFYQRTDLNKEVLKTQTSQHQDIVQNNNNKKALDIIYKLLKQTNQSNIEIILNQNASKLRLGASSFDYSAWGAVFLIAICCAAITWYQGTRTFNLIDNTYTLEVSWRIFNGEIPYRDFTLVLVPGTFVKHAILMKIFGTKAIVGLWWSMFAMACTIFLTHLILRIMDIPRWLAVSICSISASGGHIFVPYVWYNVDTIMLCFISMAMLLWSAKNYSLTKYLFPIGILAAIPIIFKQNIGLAHLVISCGIVYIHWLLFPYFFSWKRFLLFHLGIIIGLSILILPLLYLGILTAFFDNTFLLASKLRANISVIDLIMHYHPGVPLSKAARERGTPFEDIIPNYMAAFLIWGGMLFSPVVWFAGTHRNIVNSLLPLWILGISIATAYTGLMSVLSLVPLIALLLGTIYNFVKHFTKISKVSHYLTHAVAIFLVTLFVPYALTGRQLLFYKDVFTSPTPLKSSRMQGISLSPEFAIGMDELIDFVSQLPSDETIGLIPTEDPIYFATARKSPLHIVQRFTETGGNPVNLYLPELDRVKPNWVFQKVSVQFFLWEPISGAERQWLITNYSPAKRLKNYLVWKRKELEKPKN